MRGTQTFQINWHNMQYNCNTLFYGSFAAIHELYFGTYPVMQRAFNVR
jgi:hypothetical protein